MRREALPIEVKIRYDIISTIVKERIRGSEMAIIPWPFPNEKAISLSFTLCMCLAARHCPRLLKPCRYQLKKKRKKYCPDRMSRKWPYLVSSSPPHERLKKYIYETLKIAETPPIDPISEQTLWAFGCRSLFFF